MNTRLTLQPVCKLCGAVRILEPCQSGGYRCVVTCSHKGQTCLYEPITCQEAYCNRCQIHKVHRGEAKE
jgi:hypothetical protein